MKHILPRLLPSLRRPRIAVDLGTAYTRIYASRHGEVTETPSAINLAAGTSGATGDEYLQHINARLASRPLRGGVIVDLRTAVALLKPLVRKSGRFFASPVSLASAPTDATEIERNLLRQAIINAGAAQVAIMPEVWAAAIGAGIDITAPQARLLIDIGDGVTDMAVFRDGRIRHCASVRIACSDLQRTVRSAVMTKHKMQIGDREVEQLTSVPAAMTEDHEASDMTVLLPGIDIIKRHRVECCVHKKEIADALRPVIEKIINRIGSSLKRLPPKMYEEIRDSGISLTGGGACIAGMDRLIAARTGMPVTIAADPLHAVINGAIMTLNSCDDSKDWWETMVWPQLRCARI
ncbi:MAG: rod shape-determining protein [Thermodesulfobacteriota bacterium]